MDWRSAPNVWDRWLAEKWHAIVFAMKWATDKLGAVALWANGEKVLEYKDIQTAKPPGRFGTDDGGVAAE